MKPTDVDPPDLAALSAWAPELAKTFVTLASDIALVIDDAGVIRNVAQGPAEPIAPAAQDWVGRHWIDTVSGETRIKVQNLLNEVTAKGIGRRREVNHPLQHGVNVPIAYTAIRLGQNGPVLAVGRDLRAIAAIQQRFIESQQDMERGYWRARQAESRNRLLFQVATDAVMVVDPESLAILEVNHAVTRLTGRQGDQLIGKPVMVGFVDRSHSLITELLTTARSSGQSGEIRARLTHQMAPVSVAATSFRSDDAMRLLVRIRAAEDASPAVELSGTLSKLVNDTREGVIVTDSSGKIQVANPAFVRRVAVASEADVKGLPLKNWLIPQSGTANDMLARARRDGLVRRLPCRVGPIQGPHQSVDVSIALLTEGDQECLGFTIHDNVTQSALSEAPLSGSLQDGIAQLQAQLGSQRLATLVNEATTLFERHFIELALQRCGGNSQAAALMLGVGRERVDVIRDGLDDHTAGA